MSRTKNYIAELEALKVEKQRLVELKLDVRLELRAKLELQLEQMEPGLGLELEAEDRQQIIEKTMNDIEARFKTTSIEPKATSPRIARPIGSRWNKLVWFVFRKKTYEATFQPLLWDLRNEEQELLAAGHKRKALLLRALGHYYYLTEIRKVLIPIEKLFSWISGIAK